MPGRTSRRFEPAVPHRPTQELIDVILADGVDGSLVVDIGAGVGAIHLALLEAGARRAVDVDASREYLAAAREEAHRRGLDERVDYRYGDVVELASELPPADIVVLDSVICCYPYLQALLEAAIEPRPRLLGLTYPRDTWWMRTFMRAYNATHALARSPARYFIHRHRAVRAFLPMPATPRSITAGCQSGGLPSIDAMSPTPPTRFAVCRSIRRLNLPNKGPARCGITRNRPISISRAARTPDTVVRSR